MVLLWPVQIAAGDAVAAALGKGLTVTVLVAVLVQPLAPVTVTEYVVVVAGFTEMTAVVAPVPHK